MFLRYHLRNIILLSFKDKPLSSYHHTFITKHMLMNGLRANLLQPSCQYGEIM